MIAEGAKNITVPIGVGIAGQVATSGESVNIPDAYADDRFDPSHDKKTGECGAVCVCVCEEDG